MTVEFPASGHHPGTQKRTWFSEIVLWLALLSAVIIYAGLDSLLGADVRVAAFLYLAAAALLGIAINLSRRWWSSVIISACAIIYIISNMYLFSANFGVAINLNAYFAYAPLTCVALFAWIIDEIGPQTTFRRLYYFSAGYACIYLTLSVLLILTPSLIPLAAREALVIGDGAGVRADARADRIASYLTLLTYGWLYTIVALQKKASPHLLVMIVIILAAIVFTNSRIFITCVTLVTAMCILRMRPNTIFWVSTCILVLATLYYAQCLILDINPFLPFEYDTTGTSRLRQFEVANYWIDRLPFLGAGIPPSVETEQYYVSGEGFYSVDLGPVGILYSFGILGALLWIGLPIVRQLRVGADRSVYHPLTLTISTLLLNQIISPSLWSGGGTVLFAIWLGTTTVRARQNNNASRVGTQP